MSEKLCTFALAKLLSHQHDADLIFLVIGDEAEPNRKLDDLKKIIEQFEGVHFIYKQTKK